MTYHKGGGWWEEDDYDDDDDDFARLRVLEILMRGGAGLIFRYVGSHVILL